LIENFFRKINIDMKERRRKERKKMQMASSISPHSHPILTLQLKADIDLKETAKILLLD